MSDAALRTLDGDLQMIIDCTREDDTVLFRVKRPVKLSRRVDIPWRLVLGAPVDRASDARGALIAVPVASITDASGMVAVQNEMAVLRVTGGSLTLINGQFSNNVPGSVIVSTASIHASLFYCQFSRNGALDQSEGGVLCVT